uniref:Uncharacterized protein n=1 Tax=Guillardia theta TaxID=55529 RepID=A0A7S4JQD9_GUITH|mmetsp:Transcript_17929/g.58891  ORF Transcript_17929/g.58891 Transcript_17929/m.58891 type:complete len:774 (+) Transcript_17929:80-2401(+)
MAGKTIRPSWLLPADPRAGATRLRENFQAEDEIIQNASINDKTMAEELENRLKDIKISTLNDNYTEDRRRELREKFETHQQPVGYGRPRGFAEREHESHDRAMLVMTSTGIEKRISKQVFVNSTGAAIPKPRERAPWKRSMLQQPMSYESLPPREEGVEEPPARASEGVPYEYFNVERFSVLLSLNMNLEEEDLEESTRRHAFDNALMKDLALSANVPTECFEVVQVKKGKNLQVVIDINSLGLRAAGQDMLRFTSSSQIAYFLIAQVKEESSQLLRGVFTQFCESIVPYTLEFKEFVPKDYRETMEKKISDLRHICLQTLPDLMLSVYTHETGTIIGRAEAIIQGNEIIRDINQLMTASDADPLTFWRALELLLQHLCRREDQLISSLSSLTNIKTEHEHLKDQHSFVSSQLEVNVRELARSQAQAKDLSHRYALTQEELMKLKETSSKDAMEMLKLRSDNERKSIELEEANFKIARLQERLVHFEDQLTNSANFSMSTSQQLQALKSNYEQAQDELSKMYEKLRQKEFALLEAEKRKEEIRLTLSREIELLSDDLDSERQKNEELTRLNDTLKQNLQQLQDKIDELLNQNRFNEEEMLRERRQREQEARELAMLRQKVPQLESTVAAQQESLDSLTKETMKEIRRREEEWKGVRARKDVRIAELDDEAVKAKDREQKIKSELAALKQKLQQQEEEAKRKMQVTTASYEERIQKIVDDGENRKRDYQHRVNLLEERYEKAFLIMSEQQDKLKELEYKNKKLEKIVGIPDMPL